MPKEEKEKALGGYNLRPDYGQIENTATIAKSEKTLHYSEEDIVWLVKVECEIVKDLKKQKKRRKAIFEIPYKEGQENDKTSYFYSLCNKYSDLKDKEVIEKVSITKIKKCGLIETGLHHAKKE